MSPCSRARRFRFGICRLGMRGREEGIAFFFAGCRCVIFLFVAPTESAMADAGDAASTPLPPLAHVHTAPPPQPRQRPPSPVFRAPLDLVVTAGGSDIPLDINLAVKGIHVPSLQYRLQQQQQWQLQQTFRRDRRENPHPFRHLHRRPQRPVPNVTLERVPPLPSQWLRPPPSRSPLEVSSLSTTPVSRSPFDAATSAHQVRLMSALYRRSSSVACKFEVSCTYVKRNECSVRRRLISSRPTPTPSQRPRRPTGSWCTCCRRWEER